MYTLRYHRYQIFDYLLDEISLDLNLRSKDRHGNTILHYAIIYAKDDTKIVEKLMNKFNRFRIKTDERNIFGFTPLLLGKIKEEFVLMRKCFDHRFFSDFLWKI
jgi:ankyrin repeat protein